MPRLKLLAGSEGLLLDPVYSGKAMSGFIGKIRSWRAHFDDVENLVFLHTGGTASLPVYGRSDPRLTLFAPVQPATLIGRYPADTVP